MSNTTHIQKVHSEMHYVQQRILQLLNWNADEYNQFIYERGLQYLQFYLSNDKEGQRMLEGQRLFWNWWKNNWHARNKAYLSEEVQHVHIDIRIEMYMYLHDAKELSTEIKPSKTVVGDAFATQKAIV